MPPAYTPPASPYTVPPAYTPRTGVDPSVADPWMHAVPGLVAPPDEPAAMPATPAPTPAAPTIPAYDVRTNPGVIYANYTAHQQQQAAERAHRRRVQILLSQLGARGLNRSGEVGYQQGQESYAYGDQLGVIQSPVLQSYIAAWQYAHDHPELYGGIVGMPTEFGY